MSGETTEEKPKYTGYGYHGGGRKKAETGRVRFQVSCQPSEEKIFRENAERAGMSLSKYMVACALRGL